MTVSQNLKIIVVLLTKNNAPSFLLRPPAGGLRNFLLAIFRFKTL